MTLAAPRRVIVKEIPQACDGSQRRAFLSELNAEITKHVRPSVVIDCARMRQLSVPMLMLLLCCLEETMKRNGDVRLAALHPVARQALERTRVRHLFRVFGTCADAVKSFHAPVLERMPQPCNPAQADSATAAA
jgi:anti-anti-sigma regulatory factor